MWSTISSDLKWLATTLKHRLSSKFRTSFLSLEWVKVDISNLLHTPMMAVIVKIMANSKMVLKWQSLVKLYFQADFYYHFRWLRKMLNTQITPSKVFFFQKTTLNNMPIWSYFFTLSVFPLYHLETSLLWRKTCTNFMRKNNARYCYVSWLS